MLMRRIVFVLSLIVLAGTAVEAKTPVDPTVGIVNWGYHNPVVGDQQWVEYSWVNFPAGGFGYVYCSVEILWGTAGWVTVFHDTPGIIGAQTGTASWLSGPLPYLGYNVKSRLGRISVQLFWYDEATDEWHSSPVDSRTFTILA